MIFAIFVKLNIVSMYVRPCIYGNTRADILSYVMWVLKEI